MERKKEIAMKTVSAIFLSFSSSFILGFILELIIDIKFDHNVNGILYMDGFAQLIFGPLLFFTLMFYHIPKKKPKWIMIVRCGLISGLISYTVMITGLIADIATMGTDNMISIGLTLFIGFFVGLLLLELSIKSEMKTINEVS